MELSNVFLFKCEDFVIIVDVRGGKKMAKVDTLAIHEGWKPKKGEPREVPIYQSTTFKYDPS